MRHLTDSRTLDRATYLELLRRARIFHAGDRAGTRFTHLCSGKVLASLFFQASARTSSSVQAAMIKLGGGHIGFAGTQSTLADEEARYDFIAAYTGPADIVAIRDKDLDTAEFARQSRIPVINGGTSEHTLAGLGYTYTLHDATPGGIEAVRAIGMVGFLPMFRDYLAAMRVLSRLGVTVYLDPRDDLFGDHRGVLSQLTAEGVDLRIAPYAEFRSMVDAMFVTASPRSTKDALIAFSRADLAELPATCRLFYSLPRRVYERDGGWNIAEQDLAEHPQVLSPAAVDQFVYSAMAAITYLLDIDV